MLLKTGMLLLHAGFLDFGNAENYQKNVAEIRREFQNEKQ